MPYTDYVPVLGGMVKYTEKIVNGHFELTAEAVDPFTRRSLGYPTKRVVCRSKDELAVKKEQVVARAASMVRRPKKGFQAKGSETLPRSESTLREAFEALSINDPRIVQYWAKESTRKFGFRTFRHSVLPYIEEHNGILTRSEVEEFYKLRKKESGETKRSRNNIASHESNATWALRAAKVIYDVLREDCPSLPYIDFSPVHRGKPIRTEQVKALPESVRQSFSRYLEAHLEAEPLYVRGAVLMFDAAARTGEAAAVRAPMVANYVEYGVLYIRGQEKDGCVLPYPKTRAGYRNVTLSFWGITMVQRCNQLIRDYDDADRAPLRSAELSAWVRAALIACGVDSAMFDAWERLTIAEPDYNDDMHRCTDSRAYILRRDRSVRWLSICGISQADVDYYLGHATGRTSAEASNFKMPEHHRRNAQLLENYVYNPAISRHPYLHPIVLGASLPSVSYGPACGYAYRVEGDNPQTLTISGVTCEVGTAITLRVPKGIVPRMQQISLPRSAAANPGPAIGKQAKQYLQVSKEEDHHD